jgi:hypothetical protein
MEKYLEAGTIVSTHGVHGEVKILPWADGPEFLTLFDRVYLKGREYEVENSRVQKTCVLMKLKGVDTMDAAQALRDTVVKVDREDVNIIYTAEAAFIRADNHAILGAFVLKGEPLAWGLSMRGYCASIDGKVTVGVADNSPLFEEAINRDGYFFRQYPLVDDGKFVANEPKNKSVRRAICERKGEIFMIESLSKESFHDFTQALVDLGVDNAVNLAGSEAYGWAIDSEGVKHEFGTPNFYTGRGRMPKNTNYIVWRPKGADEEHVAE